MIAEEEIHHVLCMNEYIVYIFNGQVRRSL